MGCFWQSLLIRVYIKTHLVFILINVLQVWKWAFLSFKKKNLGPINYHSMWVYTWDTWIFICNISVRRDNSHLLYNSTALIACSLHFLWPTLDNIWCFQKCYIYSGHNLLWQAYMFIQLHRIIFQIAGICWPSAWRYWLAHNNFVQWTKIG